MSDEATSKDDSRPKKFLNNVEDSVSEFIEGLLLTYPNKLQELKNRHVVLAKPINTKQKVHILSGRGSGHEPSHAGWIGDGMLTGAILGGIFASPSVSSILAAIRAVTPVIDDVRNTDGRGCLLIVKNYTGDRLNFGMACEMANAEKRPCQMVIVADDCAIPRSKGETGARGVAGTVLVHKAAGAAAAQGMSLDEVALVAKQTASRIGSLGVTLEAVTLPGAVKVNNRLEGNKMEIGLGIHGEAGIRQSPLMSSKEIVKEMIDTIYEFGYKPFGVNEIWKLKPGDNVVLLVNNLGGTSNFELSILARDLVRYLEDTIGCCVSRVFVGSFMTSFNMHGASASILCLDGSGSYSPLATLIDAPTTAPAWCKADVLKEEKRPELSLLAEETVESDDTKSGEASSTEHVAIDKFGVRATNAIAAACKALIEQEPKLTEWDVIVGDGDCGLTMARGATQVQNNLLDKKLSVEMPSKLLSQLADAISLSMGGTSGILFELMLRRASTFLKTVDGPIDETAMTKAFVEGVQAGSYYGGAKIGYRTMMDALLPAADAANKGLGFPEIAEAAEEGADSTATMLSAFAGRSNYLSEEQLKNTPDPGAKAVAIILAAAANAF